MKKSMKATLLTLVALSVLAAIALVPAVVQAQEQFHGISIQKSAVGPSGLPIAHPGELVTVLIRVTNADTVPDGDGTTHDIRVDTIYDLIFHTDGVEDTGNLLDGVHGPAAPVTLVDLGDFVDVTHTYLIHENDVSPHIDSANTQGVDLGTGLNVSAMAEAPIAILRPEIDVIKTVDPELSKAGDEVMYTIEIVNTGNTDLDRVSVIDSVLGDITASFPATLAQGASSGPVNFPFVLPAGPDPFPNTVEAVYEDLTGFDVSDVDSAEVDLFEPSITLSKTGDERSKVGDEVGYTITLNNTSSDDSPDLACTITDLMLGVDEDVTLASGASHAVNASYTVQPGDPDPLVNTATATCSPVGFPNIITAEASHTVDLFQPSVMVEKDAEAGDCPLAGDTVDYGFTITNTSSPDSPDRVLMSVMDSLLGDLTADAAAAGCDMLAPGASCNFSASRVIEEGDFPGPLDNTVTVLYGVDGFPNEVSDDDSESVALCVPSIELLKTADLLGKEGDVVDFTITLTNTSPAGTPDLTCTITDEMLGIDEDVTLAVGEMHVINQPYMVQPGDPDPLVNTVEVTCNPPLSAGVQTAQALVELFQPSVMVDKSGTTQAEDGDMVTYDFTITNTSSPDSPDLMLLGVADDLLGDLTATAVGAGCGTLAPGASCNFSVGRVLLETDPDPLTNTVWVYYHPDGFENEISDSDSHSVERPHGVGGIVDFFGDKSSGGVSPINVIATGIGIGAVVVFSVALIGYIRRKRHSEV